MKVSVFHLIILFGMIICISDTKVLTKSLQFLDFRYFGYDFKEILLKFNSSDNALNKNKNQSEFGQSINIESNKTINKTKDNDCYCKNFICECCTNLELKQFFFNDTG